MKKWLVMTTLIVIGMCLTVNLSMANDWAKIRVATEGAYPPFNSVDKNGDLQGFDVDIAKAVCEAIGSECELVIQDWDGIIPGLLAKKYDCIVASMGVTEERKKKVDFTNKYYIAPAKFYAKKGAGIQITKQGLQGKTVAVQRATVYEKFLLEKFEGVVKIKIYGTQDEANLDLASGRADLGFAEPMALTYGFLNTPKGKNFEFIGPTYSDPKYFGPISIALRLGNDDLRELLNKGLKIIRDNGTYQKINAKYFPFDIYGD